MASHGLGKQSVFGVQFIWEGELTNTIISSSFFISLYLAESSNDHDVVFIDADAMPRFTWYFV